jgi:hypothetical protein
VRVILRPIEVLFLVLVGFADAHTQTPAHPFIIVRESEYDSLRARSFRWPWSIMKRKAIEAARPVSYQNEMTFHRKALLIHDLGSACALARILEPSGTAAYVGIVSNDIRTLLHDLRVEKESNPNPGDFGMNVVASHATFMAYLALDVLYNDLDPAVRRTMEDDCDYIADHQYAPWFESKYAIEGIRQLYHDGVSAGFQAKKDLYRSYLLNTTSDDGVYSTGPGYAYSRLYMEERVQKKIFMDICEYQGFHEFYGDPRLRNLYEWLFGYSVAPFNRTYTFGDTSPTKFFQEYSSAALRAGRFSTAAQGYAFWHLGSPNDDSWQGGLLQYLFCESSAFDKRQPASRIFRNGGAWLLQKEYNAEALAGVLWNINTVNETHSHFDANSITIAGYGEFFFRNSGYDNWREPDSLTWEWIHRTAESSNTLTIGNGNHTDFRGGGITEGILGMGIEYASGRSGPSLPGGMHDRSLVFVQPGNGAPGYFFLIDEVETEAGHTEVHLMLHPNAADRPAVLVNEQEYDWRIKNCFTARALHARTFLVHAPANLELKYGYLGAFDSCNRFSGSYLRATYATGPDGRARVATVIYPYPDGAIVPRFRRISSDGQQGMSMAMTDSMTDFLLTSDTGGDYGFQEMSANAAAVYWREAKGRAVSLFARNGKKLMHGRNTRFGFESERAVSLVMTGGEAEVISPGTTVTFCVPGVMGVSIDGSPAVPMDAGRGFIRISVPPGNHRIGFLTRQPD